ncbi:MAG: hypothetical protein QM785_03925 [Pyrinomonadaceae bacterium]
MKLDKIHLPTLYAKARDGFARSVAYAPTLSVDELGVPWDAISTEENNVAVRFSGRDSRSYVIETKLDLILNNGEVIGWYSLLEDENEEVFDDFLVFN